MISSAISVKILHLGGFPAYREGNIIDLGFTQFHIVDACSGLRYVLPTILIALVLGYVLNRSYVNRGLLVLLAIPVSVLSNSLRIVALAFLSRYPAMNINAEGFWHSFSGWLVFLFSVMILYSFGLLLARIHASRASTGSAERYENSFSRGGEFKAQNGLRLSTEL